MSFFDDDDPPTRAARPRRPTAPRPETTTSRVPQGGQPDDPQQLMVRRAVALGVAAVLLIIVVIGVKGCLNSRADNALRAYNRDVAAVVQDSNDQVSKRLFQLLSSGGGTSPIDLQQNVNQVRVTADEDVKRARAISVPGDMRDAQLHLLLTLTLRAGAVARIADQLPNTRGNEKRKAADLIAGQMRAFLASDVVYSQRVIPFITQTLADHNIGGQTIASSQFLPDDTWLSPATVGARLGVPGAGRAANGPVAPGLHGHGLTDVKAGGVVLQPGTGVTRVPATANTLFTVDFQNQGTNDEFDVTVKLSVKPNSGKTINVQKRVDQTKAGANATVQIPLGTAPPIGSSARVTVTVAAVPGEKKTDNNTQTYTVIFTR